MSAAVVSITNAGRTPSGGLASVATIQLSIVLSATAYATATGGIPFDLASALNTAVGDQENPVNASDILPYQYAMTTGGYVASQFAVGTPTYTSNTDSSSARSQKITYLTCPCTMRLYGSGSAQYAALSEIQDGNVTDTLQLGLEVVRGGGGL
jgi:hypothetical protein